MSKRRSSNGGSGGGFKPMRKHNGGGHGGGHSGGSGGRRNNNNGRRSNGGHGGGGGGGNVQSLIANRSKYLERAKDALSSGDRVAAENYFQYADHYTRMIDAIAPERNYTERPQEDTNDRDESAEEFAESFDAPAAQDDIVAKPEIIIPVEEPREEFPA